MQAQARLKPGAPCPITIDIAAALGTAEAVTPGNPPATGTRHDGTPGGIPTWITPEEAGGPLPSLPPTRPYSIIDCRFRVGAAGLDVEIAATPDDEAARSALLPKVLADDSVDILSDAYQAWVDTMPGTGRVVSPPGGDHSAFVRIPVDGAGDIGVAVHAPSLDAAPRLTPQQVHTVAQAIAEGFRLRP